MSETLLKQGKILIVDDEKANIRFLEIILQQAGYTNIYSTTDSRQSLALFSSIQPDIVLLDLAMPQLDGFAVMQQLRPEMVTNPIPILILTADATVATKHKALKEGAKDFLTKPLDEIEVLLRINNLLATRFSTVLLEAALRERTQELEKRTRAEAALQVSYDRLLQLENLRDQLTHMIVHDLRTPLTSFLTGLQTVEMLGELDTNQQELLDVSISGGQVLLGMINDLLDISKMEAGQLSLEFSEVAPASLLRSALQQVKYLAKSKDIVLTVEAASELPALIADEDKLRRTLVNLLGNAIKFTPDNGKVTAIVRAGESEDTVLFSVADTGHGIPKEAFEHIFEKFGQVQTHEKSAKMSTGLGLTFCKMVVEAHGGHIWVESEPQKGSSFYFSLPRRQARDSQAPP